MDKITVMRPRTAILAALATAVALLPVIAAPASATVTQSDLFYGENTNGPTYTRTTATSPYPTANITVPFRAFGFTVATAGSYTFTQTSITDGLGSDGHSYDGFADLYSGSFDPADPESNVVAAGDDNGTSHQPKITATLAVGSYVYVATSYAAGQPTGAFYVAASGPADLVEDDVNVYQATTKASSMSGKRVIDIDSDPDSVPGRTSGKQLVYVWNDANGNAEPGSPFTVDDDADILVPQDDSVRVEVAQLDATGGGYDWTGVAYPLTGTDGTHHDGYTVTADGPLAMQVVMHDYDSRPHLPLYSPTDTYQFSGPGNDDMNSGDVFYTPEVPFEIGPFLPGVQYTYDPQQETGLEAHAVGSPGGALTLASLPSLGTATVSTTSPTDVEFQQYDTTKPHRQWDAMTFDVTTAGTYEIAAIHPTDTATYWDDMLSVYAGAYDPTLTYSYTSWAPPRTAPATTLPVRDDDSGHSDDRQLIKVTLPVGRYTAVVQNYGPALGSTQLYASGPAPVVAYPVGAPAPATITAVTPGNGKATVTATAPYDSGAAVTSEHVVLTPPSGPAITADGPSPLTVSGLTNGVTYTVTAALANARGRGAASAISLVTPGAVVASAPSASGKATGPSTATVTVGAPTAPGTDAVTGYVVTLTAGKKHVTVSSTVPGAVKVTGLTPNTRYAVSVVAVSAAGTGAAGSATLTTPKPSVKLALTKGKLVATTKVSGKALGKVKVELKARKAGAKSYKTVSTKTTSSKGTVTFSTRPVAGTSYEVVLVIGSYDLTSGKIAPK